MYEHLLTLDNEQAFKVYRALLAVTDAWGFELNSSGQHLVPARPAQHPSAP